MNTTVFAHTPKHFNGRELFSGDVALAPRADHRPAPRPALPLKCTYGSQLLFHRGYCPQLNSMGL